MLKKIKELLSIDTETKEVKLEQATLENGTVIESNFGIGDEVFIVTEDEKVPLPVGEYTLEDGEKLIVKEEGIIASIGAEEEKEEEPKEEASEENLNTDNMENKEVVQEVQENLEEDKKEEMQYATKEELASLQDEIKEIKGMIEKMGEKEEMSAEEKPIEEKEELSAVEKIKHNPEKVDEKKNVFLYGQRKPSTTRDRVLSKIANINNK